ncbi:MAG: 7-cyano-7-deazaguanine synthase, partial [Bradymonadia bacterium]
LEAMQQANQSGLEENIPVTYVPARNLIFLSIAVGTAEILGAEDIFIGVNALDYSGYPDCRPDFIAAFEHTARLATRTGVTDGRLRLRTPLLDLSKKEIIELAHRLKMPLELTHSCYDPIDGLSCGCCDSCLLRLKGFESAGLADPIQYAPRAK